MLSATGAVDHVRFTPSQRSMVESACAYYPELLEMKRETKFSGVVLVAPF
jgi:hypothetical protein